MGVTRVSIPSSIFTVFYFMYLSLEGCALCDMVVEAVYANQHGIINGKIYCWPQEFKEPNVLPKILPLTSCCKPTPPIKGPNFCWLQPLLGVFFISEMQRFSLSSRVSLRREGNSASSQNTFIHPLVFRPGWVLRDLQKLTTQIPLSIY